MTIEEYIEAMSSPENEVLAQITRDTYVHILNPHMLSGQVQGRVLSMLSKMIRPRRILELGTFTGYSALCLAEGLTPDGKLITIEHNDELESTIRHNLSLSPLGSRIDLLIGDAIEILSAGNGPIAGEAFDLVFIDPPYHAGMYEEILSKVFLFDILNDGGIILVESMRGESLPPAEAPYVRGKTYSYGKISLTVYSR